MLEPAPICSMWQRCRRLVEQRPSARSARLDVLVNNASSFYPTPLGTITARMGRPVGTNLRAPLFLAQAQRRCARPHGTDHQHDRHPRAAAAARASGVLHRQGGSGDADAFARARTRARDSRQRHRARPVLWPEAGIDAGCRTRSSRRRCSNAAARRRTSCGPRYFSRQEASYVTGQILRSTAGGASDGDPPDAERRDRGASAKPPTARASCTDSVGCTQRRAQCRPSA